MSAPEPGYVVPAPRPGLAALADAWAYRGLLWSFVLREVQVRYRQAALGVLWAVLQPLALTLATTLLFHEALGVEGGSVPYPLFAYTGLVAWTFFHAALQAAVPSLVQNAHLVRKIWFPRETIPFACVGAALLDLGASLVVWLGFFAWYGIAVPATVLWVLPLLGILVAFTAALALLGAAVNVRFRDVKHALPLLLQLLFFATPIVYPLDAVPERWRPVVLLQPLAGVVEGLRRAALEGRAPDLATTATAAAVSLALLVVSWLLFRAADRRFADVI
jgi:ABC-type polysaccharide/polyol phosphate export permease